jgi:hypothetical protein
MSRARTAFSKWFVYPRLTWTLILANLLVFNLAVGSLWVHIERAIAELDRMGAGYGFKRSDNYYTFLEEKLRGLETRFSVATAFVFLASLAISVVFSRLFAARIKQDYQPKAKRA